MVISKGAETLRVFVLNKSNENFNDPYNLHDLTPSFNSTKPLYHLNLFTSIILSDKLFQDFISLRH